MGLVTHLWFHDNKQVRVCGSSTIIKIWTSH